MTIEKPLSSQLMIVRARKEDSGDYMCQVKLDGQIKVEPAKITFISKYCRQQMLKSPKSQSFPLLITFCARLPWSVVLKGSLSPLNQARSLHERADSPSRVNCVTSTL